MERKRRKGKKRLRFLEIGDIIMRILVIKADRKTAKRGGEKRSVRLTTAKKEVENVPILQYKCKTCGKKFEELVRVYTDVVVCPDCGGATERDYSGEMYSATGKTSKKCSGNCATCGGCH